MTRYASDGFEVFKPLAPLTAWARAAHRIGCGVARDPDLRAQWLRHGETWFVGVDALPNDARGTLGQDPLIGPWTQRTGPWLDWHRGQLSVVYPGYPRQDPGQSDANHQFRITRFAAHVDGLLPEAGRRILREPHAFIVGIPLNNCSACPLVVWPGSHKIMGDAFRAAAQSAKKGQDLDSLDLTDAYHAARAEVFETTTPLEVHMRVGHSVLLHRHLLHGMAPWKDGDAMPPEGRMIAYFRPQFDSSERWLTAG